MNKVILKGNVGHTPEVYDFKDGGFIARFTLATTERGFKTKDGKEIAERTTWHTVIVRRPGLVTLVGKYVEKGDPLLIIGKYESRKYTNKDGVEKEVYEVNADEIELCKKSGEKTYNDDDDLPPAFNL